MASHCMFWLKNKNRFCANTLLSHSSYCGNHTQRSNDQWLPCPIDPSHNVLEENLESHLKRCPLLKQSQSLSSQRYYQKGINAGKENEKEEDEDEAHEVVTSEMKRNVVYALNVQELFSLIDKIKSIHASICKEIQESFKIPEACHLWTNREVDKKLPYQEKHVLQQASILGNLEHFGVLGKPKEGDIGEQSWNGVKSVSSDDVPAVVEFGAGRGYLTQVLADCYGIKKVILVERKAYKLKADRSLRQKESLSLERLRIDIEDLKLDAVDSLKEVPYLAISKHLCGPATDMSMRCCIPEEHQQNNAEFYLKGLALATCCHHLCQWKHYINKKYMLNLGISKEEFNALSWFTSWAVDADHCSKLSEIDYTSHLQIMDREDFYTLDVADVVRNMKSTDRAMLGFMCKDIIDTGRWKWLKEQHLESHLVYYVPSTISPENHLLLAWRSSKS
ncbi:hypothetical protein Leryth_024502 [Lithospermum erythrorhizon]|nr:hypothetical protein Leryth_024502 [Lithospermum erythrorhizon]